MLPIYTSAEIREIDRDAAEHFNLPTALLMENAGRAVADVVLERWREDRTQIVVVVCGKGNNGGDGYVAARHLKAAGVSVSIVALAASDTLKGDAQSNARAAALCGIPIQARLDGNAASARVIIVDAILGTGLSRAAEGLARELIEAIRTARAQGAWVVAVDVPSGVNADVPHAPGVTVEADVTVALHALKPAHVQYPARVLCGRVQLASIGLPDSLGVSTTFPARGWIEAQDVRLAKRGSDSHKGREERRGLHVLCGGAALGGGARHARVGGVGH
jgi:hydroxyethylthiazole kinase-like uncharacterized protein yjeF